MLHPNHPLIMDTFVYVGGNVVYNHLRSWVLGTGFWVKKPRFKSQFFVTTQLPVSFSAEIYNNTLQQPEKAKQLYEKIIFNHQDSIYFLDARKEYRQLRGDNVP